MSYAFGQPVPLSVNVKDATGVAANATAVTVTVTLPDGTTVTPSVNNPTTGLYTATFVPTLAGLHQVRWVATGTNASAAPPDSFTVYPTGQPLAVSLAEIRASINDTSSVNDDELTAFSYAAQAVIEDMVGAPLVPTTITEIHDGGQRTIVLRVAPVASVTSVAEWSGPSYSSLTAQPQQAGMVFDGYGYTVNLASGVLSRTSGGYPRSFPSGSGNVAVTYRAGFASVPENVRRALLDLIAVNWNPQRSAGPSLLADDAPYAPDANRGFYVPNSVRQMLAPNLRAPRVG